MSLLKANSIQIGQSNTATNNFTLSAADQNGTIKLSRGNSGATVTDILTVNSNGTISGATISGGTITLGTAVNAATGSPTSIDFTGIPNWTKKITVMLYGVSTNSTSNLILQVGTSSGIVSSSYGSFALEIVNATSPSTTTSTAGILLSTDNSASDLTRCIITLVKINGNIWLASGTGLNGSWGTVYSGSIELGSDLDRVRITTINGTDTFDAGTINIMYEG